MFFKENKMFIKNKKKVNDYYLLSEMYRKELLSDILEYESILTEKIIVGFGLDEMSMSDMSNNDVSIFNSIECKKWVNQNLIRHNYANDKVVSKIFNSLSFGSKIKIIKKINRNEITNVLFEYLQYAENFVSHIKSNKKLLSNYLFPILEYIKDIRNYLSHRRFSLDLNYNLKKAYKLSNKKYRIDILIPMVGNQLLLIHKKSFNKRFESKVRKNKKISNKIFKEIISRNKDFII